MICECNYGPQDRCPAHSERRLSLYELREQRVRDRKGMSDDDVRDQLPHLSECKCPCHHRLGVDDGGCDGAPFTPASVLTPYACCYGGPRRPACDGCGRQTWSVSKVEGLALCRACRRAVR